MSTTAIYAKTDREALREIHCWGDNFNGQLGNGAALPGADSSTPVTVTGIVVPG